MLPSSSTHPLGTRWQHGSAAATTTAKLPLWWRQRHRRQKRWQGTYNTQESTKSGGGNGNGNGNNDSNDDE
jgi:hypothetical protein